MAVVDTLTNLVIVLNEISEATMETTSALNFFFISFGYIQY